MEKPVEFIEDVFFVVEGGEIVLRYPRSMTPETFVEFKAWMELEIRKIARWTQTVHMARHAPVPPPAEDAKKGG